MRMPRPRMRIGPPAESRAFEINDGLRRPGKISRLKSRRVERARCQWRYQIYTMQGGEKTASLAPNVLAAAVDRNKILASASGGSRE